jgi:hypothetical protein
MQHAHDAGKKIKLGHEHQMKVSGDSNHVDIPYFYLSQGIRVVCTKVMYLSEHHSK